METVKLMPPVPPDADYDAVRARALGVVQQTQETAERWTDHNAADPGITLLEAAAWAYADLHYRTEERAFDAWSAETAGWRSAELPRGTHHRRALALVFSIPANAAAARAIVTAAGSRARAVQELRTHRFARASGGGLTIGPRVAEGVVRLLREPLVLRAALDRSAALETAVADAATEPAARAAVAAVVEELGLWEEEVADLVAFVRRAAFVALLRDHGPSLRALVDAAVSETDALAALAGPSTLADGAIVELADPLDRRAALAVHPFPPVQPELWEHPDHATTLWPPHPLQARTCEPVTLADYRRLALSASGVRRAWAVPGLGQGVAWDGSDQAAVPSRRGGLTLLVERAGVAPKPYTSALDAGDRAFLKDVLRQALGSPNDTPAEVDDPLPDYRDGLNRLGPRRLLGDEPCAALVTSLPVVVRGTLEISPTADGGIALAEARRRLARFLSEDKEAPFFPPAEPSGPLDCPRALDGPWPREAGVAAFLADPEGRAAAGGWHPGDPVRVSEVVQLLTSVPGVLGADTIELQEDGAAAWEPEVLAVPPFSVPAFARDCLVLHVLDPRECGA
ncbi:MAG TPA: hypothetical protein VLN26_16495, partial [Gaiellaceae bacterium]|nr:hypothetical protein [Gaiellaceae bacterium]